MRTLGGKLMGGRKVTFYNTTISDGYTTSGYTPVNVYYNTAYHYNTTYSHVTSGTTTLSRTTSVPYSRETNRETWVSSLLDTRTTYFIVSGTSSYTTSWTSNYSYTTSYLVDTWMPVQTYYVSNQYYEFWTDTSYSQQTWRETSW